MRVAVRVVPKGIKESLTLSRSIVRPLGGRVGTVRYCQLQRATGASKLPRHVMQLSTSARLLVSAAAIYEVNGHKRQPLCMYRAA